MHLEPIISIFSDEIFKLVSDNSEHIYKNETLRPSVTFWDSSKVELSRPVLTHRLPTPDEVYQKISEEVKRIDESKEIKEISYYYWTPGSYMPWQGYDDSISDSLTVYLNSEWKIKDGGILLHASGELVGAIKPHPNLGVFKEVSAKYSTTILGLKAPILRTLEVEFKDLKDDRTESII